MGDHFLYSSNINVWFGGEISWEIRLLIIITLGVQRVKANCLPENDFLNLLLEWDYFTLIYEPGELTNASTLSSFQTEIIFHCNKSAVWKRSDGESGNNSVTYPPKVTVSSTKV